MRPTRLTRFLPYSTIAILLLITGADAQSLSLVSTNASGAPANRSSIASATSKLPHYVAFDSNAFDIVANDFNSQPDIFLKNLQTQSTIRINVGPGGIEANGLARWPSMADDGSVVVFASNATNLLPLGNAFYHIYAYTVATGQLRRVSVSSAGMAGNNNSDLPTISKTGRYVGFMSHATNLVPGDTNGSWDAFVHDMVTGVTSRVSISSTGAEANGPSNYPYVTPNGRWAVFESVAPNLVPSDTNQASDVFVRDMLLNQTVRASVDALGHEGSLAASMFEGDRRNISDNGRYVVFSSDAPDLVPNDTNQTHDVFLKDLWTGSIARVNLTTTGQQAFSPGSNNMQRPMISSDGRFVVFSSIDSNLVPNDTNNVVDVFLRDTFLNTTTLISQSSQGVVGDYASSIPYITSDGRNILFRSRATNLTGAPVLGYDFQIYLYSRQHALAHTEYLGGGCHGALSVAPTFDSTPAVLGTNVILSGSGLDPHASGILFWGMPAANPLVVAPGCTVHLELSTIQVFMTVQSAADGSWSYTQVVPNDMALRGLTLTFQGLFDGSNPAQLVITDAVSITLGD